MYELAESTDNPILRSISGPSDAYLRSRENARKRCDGSAEFFDEKPKAEKIGTRTLLVTLIMCITGLILFITGAVIFWGSNGHEKHNQGKDILVVSAILLLPGTYGAIVLFGTWRKWPGYSYRLIPSFD